MSAATMKSETSESVKEQSKMVMAIKTEIETEVTFNAHIDSDVDLNDLKQEAGLIQTVKSERALLVKEEILEDGSQAGNEQQCVQGTTTPASTGRVNEDCGTSLRDLLNVKYKLDVMDIGPVVFQHMDIHYTINKNMIDGTRQNTIVDDCSKAMPCSEVKTESIEEKLRGSITPQNATMNKQSACSTLQTPQFAVHRGLLESICRVHLMRLDTFQCESCDAAYTEKRWLILHLKSVHESSLQSSLFVKFHKANKHQSATEHKKLDVRNSKTSMTTGRAVADGSTCKVSLCYICGARFAQIGHFNRHMRVHTGEKPYQCTTCDAKFAQNYALIVHMRVHTGEKPPPKSQKCTTCDARFSGRCALTRHKRVHTGEKPYQCTTCDARFAQRFDLSKHMRVHTGEKPFECSECGAKFVRKDSLIRHMRRRHRK